MIYPLKNMVVTSPFGMRLHPVTNIYKLHNGIDLRGSNGTPIFSVDKGKVKSSYFNSAGGNQVIIQHNGYTTGYAHLQDVLVSEGQELKKGQEIGTVGSSGAVTGSHLHFVIKKNDEYQEPIKFMQDSINKTAILSFSIIAVVLIAGYYFLKYYKK
jgi:murein DD-endopeptidase MepM/ murein hydrolase activator NlpD